VPTTAGRRIGIVVVLLLLAGAGALATLPRGAGALRVGALSVLWWYAALLAPSLAVAVTVAVLVPRRPRKSSGPTT
jgi:membrane protein implicated in regulation of membrane protease activity